MQVKRRDTGEIFAMKVLKKVAAAADVVVAAAPADADAAAAAAAAAATVVDLLLPPPPSPLLTCRCAPPRGRNPSSRAPTRRRAIMHINVALLSSSTAATSRHVAESLTDSRPATWHNL